MVVYENISETLVKAYSDADFMIRQDSTGDMYAEAIDPIVCHRTYTETDIPIEPSEEEPTSADYESALSRLGVE